MQHLWGSSEVVFEYPCFLLVRAHATGGKGASSIHHHKYHANSLLVQSGSMLLELFSDTGELTEEIVLREGQKYDVPPGVNHRLTFNEPAEILEWYVPQPGEIATLDDIFRLIPGTKAVA